LLAESTCYFIWEDGVENFPLLFLLFDAHCQRR
jgi:hypothetical protein